MNTVTCDIDGTVVVYNEEPDFGLPHHLVGKGIPNPATISYLHELVAGGVDLHFVTARRASSASVTLQQLQGLLPFLEQIHVHCLPDDDWDPVKAFNHKAATLARLGSYLHIGDEPVDRDAAVAAGAAFLHVNTITASREARLRLAGVDVVA